MKILHWPVLPLEVFCIRRMRLISSPFPPSLDACGLWHLVLGAFAGSSRASHNASVITLARPPTLSLKITSRSVRYASPHLRNQLPHSLRQPRLDLPIPDSSLLQDHLTSRVSSSPLLSSITPSFFFSNLKTSLFLKSYPP